jgi:ribonuclease D
MHTWIESGAALAAWLDAHANATMLCLDTEFMRTDTFVARLALMQLCIDGEVALIDVVAARPQALIDRLGDGRAVCVMHSASEDLEAMLPLLPDGPGELFDTQIAAAMAGLGYGLSYQKLVGQLLGVELAKAETRSDWLRRPLNAAQLDYAALDVAWLPQLHDLLAAKLDALGRLQWLREDCRALVERVCHARPDAQPQRAFRTASEWPPESQAMLRRLLQWRDAAARRLDKPRPWLLDDAAALSLAARLPRDADELFERTRGLRALRGTQRQELLGVLQAPLSAEDLAIEPIPPPLDGAQKRALAEMKTAVAAVAASLDLPEGLLCSRRHLEALLTDRVWPGALEGWRRPVLQEELMGKMP